MLESQHKVPVNIHQLVMKLNLRTYCLCLIVLSDCLTKICLCAKKENFGSSTCLIWELLIVYRWIGLRSLPGRKKNRDDMCFKKCF